MHKVFFTIFICSIAIIMLVSYGSAAMEPQEVKDIRAEFAVEQTLMNQRAEREKREVMQRASMSLASSMSTAAVMVGILIKILIGAICVTVGAMGLWIVRWATRPNLIRFENGMAPIVEKNVAPWWKQLLGASEVTYANPNQFLAPFVKVVHDGGSMQTLTDTMGMPIPTLAEAHKGAQRVQMAQAGLRRQPAPSKWETLANNGLLEQAIPQRREQSTSLALASVSNPRLTLREAIARSNVKDGFIIGQEVDTNEPCLARPRETAHFSLLGASQQGKTTTATTFVVELHAAGFHVLILDPEVEGYWSIFKNHAEVVETNGEDLLFHLGCIEEEYERRGRLLNEQGVNHYNRLVDAPPRIMIVIEEFSDLLASSARKSADHERVLEILERMARRYAKRGMHLFILDQHYKEWPGPLLENVSWRATHRQGRKDYSLANYDGIDRLPLGHFAYNGNVYVSFRIDEEIMAILAELPRFRYERIVGKRQNVTDTPHSLGVDEMVNSGNVTPEQSRSDGVLPSFLRSLLGVDGKVKNAAADSNEWDELAALLFARKPGTTQADLCRMMAEADPLNRPYTAFKGSLSMDLYHCYSQNGDFKKIQTAKRKEIWRDRNG